MKSEEFKNRSQAIQKAIDRLLGEYYPDMEARTLKEAVLEANER